MATKIKNTLELTDAEGYFSSIEFSTNADGDLRIDGDDGEQTDVTAADARALGGWLLATFAEETPTAIWEPSDAAEGTRLRVVRKGRRQGGGLTRFNVGDEITLLQSGLDEDGELWARRSSDAESGYIFPQDVVPV
jgi:hypothetical protein